ncbi:MAG: Ppk protein, partial [Acidobacteria bacterium]|nr:Ppk protein [Acidobacteriota bacterium]
MKPADPSGAPPQVEQPPAMFPQTLPTLTSPGTIKVPPIAVPPKPVRLLNREFSWIEFNRRVLAEVNDPTVPLLERAKFLSITSTNLDEFVMVRAGAIRELSATGIRERSADGLTPKQQLRGIRERVKALMGEMYRSYDTLLGELKKQGITIERFSQLSKKEQLALRDYFDRQVAPILTPLAVDPSHPFPFLASQTLNIAIALESERGESHVALVKVPPLLPRLIPIPESTSRYVPLESLIGVMLDRFFPGLQVRKVVPFRVLRNADIALQEDEVQDLLKSVESEMRRRDRKEVVWMEVADDDELVIEQLSASLHVTGEDIFVAPAFLKLGDLMELYRAGGKTSLFDPPFNPRIAPQLASSEDIFSIIRKGDVLLHRPYDSFSSVVEFVQTASEDPDVAAIKMTLYRTGSDSPVIDALVRAAQRGKQVTAIVELQARFDEMKNITWARRLEEEGVQVVYGLVGIKTHCKLCLVIRREGNGLRRYVHLSTGNYNALTARLYTDVDLLTTDDRFGDDASRLLNLLTGYSTASIQDIFDRTVTVEPWSVLAVAPIDYHEWTLRMIERELRNAREGKPAQIIAKMNALVDPTVI